MYVIMKWRANFIYRYLGVLLRRRSGVKRSEGGKGDYVVCSVRITLQFATRAAPFAHSGCMVREGGFAMVAVLLVFVWL